MSRYTESNADERTADLAERNEERARLNAERQADEDREIDLDAYNDWWLSRVTK